MTEGNRSCRIARKLDLINALEKDWQEVAHEEYYTDNGKAVMNRDDLFRKFVFTKLSSMELRIIELEKTAHEPGNPIMPRRLFDV